MVGLQANRIILLYCAVFYLQITFYLAAILHALLGERLKSRLLSFPYYFCHGNAAALIALIKFIRGERIVMWEPLRR